MKKIQEFFVKMLPHDKMLHFFVGFFLYVISCLIFDDNTALAIVVVVAILKEIRDIIVNKVGDLFDIIFTLIPAIIMILID